MCDICGKPDCHNYCHSLEEQERYGDVIKERFFEAFACAREMRRELQEEANEQ